MTNTDMPSNVVGLGVTDLTNLTNPTQPINPFKAIRESIKDPTTGRHISHAALAKRIGCTKLSLIRLEQGTFNDPLPTVLDYFIKQGYNYLSLTDGYINFQHQTRLQNCYLFGTSLTIDVSSPDHPFKQLYTRVHSNPTEVSKRLCIPQATLSKFERDPRGQQSVPKTLINVLPVIGYTDEQISQFLYDYKDWRNRYLGKNVVSIEANNFNSRRCRTGEE
jgi:DNA-binding XRE family transcriptional regulator